MEDFKKKYKIQMINPNHINQVELMADSFTQVNVVQSVYKDWKVDDLFILSYKTDIYSPGLKSELWFSYILRVTNEYGRGLSLIVPNTFQKYDRTFKKIYRDHFKIPMFACRATFNEFAHTYANNEIPADSFFADPDGNYLTYDEGFVSKETTPVWYLLNAAKVNECTLYLTEGFFRPKSNFNIRKPGEYRLSIYYGPDTQKNLDAGKPIYDGFDEADTKDTNTKFRFH